MAAEIRLMEIKATQQKIGLVMQVLMTLELSEFLAHIDRYETLGQILEPTAYIAASDGMAQWRDLAKALREVQKVGERYGLGQGDDEVGDG